jgi:nicotinamide mononucleotide adenylyltransferase
LQTLLSQHGVVCVARAGSETGRLLDAPGSLLHTYRRNVLVVEEPVPNEISSSRVRHELEQGHSVRYLLPDPVAQYIYEHGLYGTDARGTRPRVLHPAAAKVDTERD